jgi:hypothetical protein
MKLRFLIIEPPEQSSNTLKSAARDSYSVHTADVTTSANIHDIIITILKILQRPNNPVTTESIMAIRA